MYTLQANVFVSVEQWSCEQDTKLTAKDLGKDKAVKLRLISYVLVHPLETADNFCVR